MKKQKKTNVKISPKEAQKILEQEFDLPNGMKARNELLFSTEPFLFRQSYISNDNNEKEKR